MRIGHIADVHLGYASGSQKVSETLVNLREQDGYDAFFAVIDGLIAEKVDCVVICGDLFHTPTPSTRTITVAQEGIDKLVENNIPVYNLAGNHDATDYVRDVPANRILHQPRLKVYSEVAPYVLHELAEDIVLHLVSHHNFVFQDSTMDKLKPIPNKINILCTHGSCYDSTLGSILHTEGSPREVVISEEVLSLGWDYIWLGHIHTRGWVGSKDGLTDTENKRQFYAGSLIRRGYSDKECQLGRGFTVWNVTKDGITPEMFTIPQRTQLDMIFECKSKTLSEIDSMLEEFFSTLDISDKPIIRLNFIEIDKVVRSNLDFSRWHNKIKECLNFVIKSQTKEELRKFVNEVDFSFSLMDSFNSFWENTKENYKHTNSDNIKQICTDLLKQSELNISEE